MQVVASQAPATSRNELTALLAGCATYRVNRALFSIAGRDRTRWLNGMVSNNIRDLAPGKGVYAFVLNPQGHVLGDLYVFNRGESLVAEIERDQAQALLQGLRRYIIMDKVEIEDLSGEFEVIGITGPRSTEVFASVGLNADLPSLGIAKVEWSGLAVTLVRGDNTQYLSYELWVPAPSAETALARLIDAGAEEVGSETLETFRILCGIPKVGQDIRERTLPQETGQDRALNFNKGCYIGQEIVERIRARGAVHRMFIGFQIEGPPTAAGTKIQGEGKDVGEITSAMAHPLKGKQLALGYLRKESLGKELTAGEANVRAVTLPFTDIFS